MDCQTCQCDRLDLVVIRQPEDASRQIWTYMCSECLSYVNQYFENVELVREEWGTMHGR
jgi:hypothetical protein